VQGAVFILAIDRQQLENSAKMTFGPDLDFGEYFRKFVHREVALPPISESGYLKLAHAYVEQYLELEDTRYCHMKFDQSRIDNIVDLIAALKLTPRQIQEVFRILGHLFETSEKNKGCLLWCFGVGSIAMAAFKVGNPRVFHLLGARQLDPKEARKFLTNLLVDKHVDWWFALFLTGGGLKRDDEESDEAVLREAGFSEKELGSQTLQNLGQLHQGWGRFLFKGLVLTHEKIEQISQWN